MQLIKETPVKTHRKFDQTFKREAVQNWLASGKSVEVNWASMPTGFMLGRSAVQVNTVSNFWVDDVNAFIYVIYPSRRSFNEGGSSSSSSSLVADPSPSGATDV